VAKVTLDLNLATQLVLDAGLEELRLLEDFEGDNVFRGLLTGEVNRAELAAPEGLADLRVCVRCEDSRA